MANAAKRDPELSILMAEDDPDDRLLLVDAVDEAALHLDIEFVGDGIELWIACTGSDPATWTTARPCPTSFCWT